MKTDAQIKQDVLAELKWDAEVDETKIGVGVTNGAVTLTGHVPTYSQKLAALRAVKRVAGVLAFLQHPRIEGQPAELTVDETLRPMQRRHLPCRRARPGARVGHLLNHLPPRSCTSFPTPAWPP